MDERLRRWAIQSILLILQLWDIKKPHQMMELHFKVIRLN